MNRVEHTLDPVYSKESRTLILGSMPSSTSRKLGKYYGHKSNRFWPIMSTLYQEKIDDWKNFILKHNLALWDVISSCDIEGSNDASISNPEVNDIKELVSKTKIDRIFVLGKTAYGLYQKFIEPDLDIQCINLPSPSSANAQYSLEELVALYSVIKR